MRMQIGGAVAAFAATALASSLASAHTGVTANFDLAHGFAHPLGGLDHLLAMLAVGIWAAQMGGRAMLLLPASFVGLMLGGAGLALSGIALPFVEPGILLSVLLFGLLIALRARPPVLAAMVLTGVFALFHGHAHGAEVPTASDLLFYALGFTAATALLHAMGIGLAVVGRPLLSRWSIRGAGAAIGVAGLVLTAGA